MNMPFYSASSAHAVSGSPQRSAASGQIVAAMVYTPLANLEFSAAAEVYDLLRRKLGSPRYDFQAASLRPGIVRMSSGVEIFVRNGLEAFDRAHTIVIPSWSAETRPPPELLAALNAAYKRGARLLAMNTGAFLLAATGLLDRRRATTHWMHADELARRHPKVTVEPDVLYIDEGQLVTGAGSAAGLDMLLHVIRRDHGPRLCNAIARELLSPPHRQGGQAQRVQRPVPRSVDTRLAKVIEYIRTHANQPHRIEDLAAMAAMSAKSFNRKFRDAVGTSPYAWLTQERVEIAKELLEESSLSIDQIGAEAGFGSTQSFRTSFKNIVGVKPATYRRGFAFRRDAE